MKLPLPLAVAGLILVSPVLPAVIAVVFVYREGRRLLAARRSCPPEAAPTGAEAEKLPIQPVPEVL